MSYTEYPHIRKWMSEHECRVLGIRYSRLFHEYLESLPWLPTGIDWSEVQHVVVSLENGDPAGDLERLNETPIGRHPYVVVSYQAEDKAIMCMTRDAFRDADVLYMRSPGQRYMCGADYDGDSIVLSVQDFAEYDLPGFTVRL